MKSPLTSQTGTPTATAPSNAADLALLLTAWDQTHPTATAPDLDWRHLLDEMAHPTTTEAFHHLAEAAA
ncbi:hypothetical protein [Streptomyces sp. YU58]|uniref:hypothetical protein n=1 Tax=Streptomyces sp. SX92 TaxID=3158972 RepID=UPI0027B96843|nr:hypothetical protein [Streptomyces coralus]WLW54060.1 hypothetical protein QU709_23080 [Streptomyces coralus]